MQQESVEKARQQVLANPDSAEAHFQLADVLSKGRMTEDTFREIAGEYSKAIQLRPDYPDAYLGLAVIQGFRHKREEQLQSLDKAILLKPDYADAYCKLGFVHLGPILGEDPGFDVKKQAKLAARAFTKAIQIKPDLGEAYVGLGLSNYYLQQYKGSLEAFKKSVLLNPGDIVSHKALGSLYIEFGDEQSAIQEYEALKQIGERMQIDLEALGHHPQLNLAQNYSDDLLKEIKKRFVKK